MANFKKAFDVVIKHEGYYVNDPDDMGGETYLGITRKNHKDSKMWDIIDDIKKEYGISGISHKLKQNEELDSIVEGIYKPQYWDCMRLDELKSDRIALQLFDHGVNAGVSRAVRLAQRLCGVKETGKFSSELFDKLNEYEKIV